MSRLIIKLGWCKGLPTFFQAVKSVETTVQKSGRMYEIHPSNGKRWIFCHRKRNQSGDTFAVAVWQVTLIKSYHSIIFLKYLIYDLIYVACRFLKIIEYYTPFSPCNSLTRLNGLAFHRFHPTIFIKYKTLKITFFYVETDITNIDGTIHFCHRRAFKHARNREFYSGTEINCCRSFRKIPFCNLSSVEFSV